MKESEKPTVFISFNNKYRDFVDCLEERLSKEANVLRYEDQIPAWGSFVSFMDTIKEQDFAVLVISDEYLKSFACMYEVKQVMKCDNWKDKVMFALMPGVKPYADDARIEYIEHWNNQYETIKNKTAKLPHKSAKSLIEKSEQIKHIRDSMDEFLNVIADSNCPPIYTVIEKICEKVQISKKAVFTMDLEDGSQMSMRLWCILDYIIAHPTSTISEISKAIGLSIPSASYSVRKLVELGMIIIETHGRTRLYSAA